MFALAVLLAAGCQKSAQIGHYQVPKEGPSASAKTAAATAGPDRMVAAIVPHAGVAWFFKLAGPAEAVSKHAEAFETLVKSVTFTESVEGNPQWTLPAGWKQESGGADLRFATITIPDKPPLEITVTTLPWSDDHDLEQVLSNLNRWHGQMTLAPLDTADLADQIRWVKLSDGEAIVVDYHGTLKAGGMQPPFAAAAGAMTSNQEAQVRCRLGIRQSQHRARKLPRLKRVPTPLNPICHNSHLHLRPQSNGSPRLYRRSPWRHLPSRKIRRRRKSLSALWGAAPADCCRT